METVFVLNVIRDTLCCCSSYIQNSAQTWAQEGVLVVPGPARYLHSGRKEKNSSHGPCFQAVLGQWLLLERICEGTCEVWEIMVTTIPIGSERLTSYLPFVGETLSSLCSRLLIHEVVLRVRRSKSHLPGLHLFFWTPLAVC